jgi:hypothetical protein
MIGSASNSAASDKGHTGALYSKNSDPAAGVGMALFTTALDLHGGVLWSGEFQGFIIHELVPNAVLGVGGSAGVIKAIEVIEVIEWCGSACKSE